MFSANSSQVSEDRLYVEGVFSTYLYAGTSTADNKITNGIDLAGKGGMVWLKSRTGATSNYLTTNSTTTSSGGGTTWLYSDTTDALLGATGTGLCNFFSDGFDINPTGSGVNGTGNNYASWTFREAPKFFDVVTYTGNGANRNIAHSLGVAPGCIIVKRTDAAADWQVYHRSNANTEYMVLNTTAAKATGTTRWNSTTPTATEFTVGTDTTVNASGGTYVAYLFAHDTTSDGIIQCGSYTGNGSSTGPSVTLGWEPQWLLVKDATSASWDWRIVDNMRGMPVGSGAASLFPNLTNAEFTTSTVAFSPTATGFQVAGSAAQINTNGNTYIYIAIRRGPMRTPTSGTSVFSPIIYTGNATSGTARTTGFVTDTVWSQQRTSAANPAAYDRLRGSARYLSQSLANAEVTQSGTDLGVSGFDTNNGYLAGADQTQSGINFNGYTYVNWAWRRAPSFYDQVCYTGTETNRSVNHSLGVVPELIIVKQRDALKAWTVYSSGILNTEYLVLNSTAAKATAATYWNSTTATSTTFSLGTSTVVNSANSPYVAYLFASCPGVSKVGTYTGNGSSQTINCGFAAGARFVMIKRTDSTGDWYIWDTARGIVAGNDPHLSINTNAAEVTSNDTIDTDSSGFVVNQVAATNINVSSATYIYLAVA